ncbi:GNAT family N-acetyltransferase [Rossellomorea sp. SC111]|uniref:GNAT family N-acetyltransferase n=1 Tax=Rossellomorea sp. SC111 TaxID=2968985 RepID=UPI00215A54E0|nr:GNAT family N-acetyltransferase [Rossellomorea sp. SC111]MCR8851046.1 GNAT family N-acetyltransferase [Rossellomorea sp. SC111]
MIGFEKNQIGQWKIEQEIMNSNPAYNLLSKNKEIIDFEDICAEYEESERLGIVRLFIKKDSRYIGLIDYTLNNPKDQTPWVSLFVIHQRFQGAGYSMSAHGLLEDVIRRESHTKLRLAVHQENDQGIKFWNKLGYEPFKEVVYEGRQHCCLEKFL